jgi:hypothetical protein
MRLSTRGRPYTGLPVCRSVAMNNWIGHGWDTEFNVFHKSSDMTRPGPANTFVILDESQNSINDGFFAVPMDTYDRLNLPGKAFVDVPATYHAMSGSFSFADGHSEIHKWLDPATKLENKYCGCIAHYAENGFYTVAPRSPDVAWLQERTSSKLK